MNQAKIGEIMARLEDENANSFKECLKNGVKIHKRHRELFNEVAKENGWSNLNDVVNINNKIIDKFKMKLLKGRILQLKTIVDVTYDSIKTIEYYVLVFNDSNPKTKEEIHHLRQGYLAFIDDLQAFVNEK